MAEYLATVRWQRGTATFSDNLYSRAHTWEFDGGVEVPASSSPHVVPIPLSNPANVDPEEAFVAAVSSCHMLTFLGIAAKKRYVVDSYDDVAVGIMEEDGRGRMAITRVILRPEIRFSGKHVPSPEQLAQLHELAHKNCFIANSITAAVEVAGLAPDEG